MKFEVMLELTVKHNGGTLRVREKAKETCLDS